MITDIYSNNVRYKIWKDELSYCEINGMPNNYMTFVNMCHLTCRDTGQSPIFKNPLMVTPAAALFMVVSYNWNNSDFRSAPPPSQ